MAELDTDADFARFDSDGEYVCVSCGEMIVVPVDASAGRHQEYVEDCPVCCHANRLVLDWSSDGSVVIRSEVE